MERPPGIHRRTNAFVMGLCFLLTIFVFSAVLFAQVSTSESLAAAAASKKAAKPSFVPLITDKTKLIPALPTKFGDAGTPRVNQAGDIAFNIGNALFLRRASATSAKRLLQAGDAVPGLSKTQIDFISSVYLNNGGPNSAGKIAVLLGYSTDGARSAIYIYEGTSFRKLVSSEDPAPGTSGASIGGMTLIGFNDAGEAAFLGNLNSRPGGPDLSTFFLKGPHDSFPIRLLGNGDTLPGIGTVDQLYFFPMNNLGEVLFSARINGSDSNWALLVASRGGVRMPASNLPWRLGANQALLNDAGAVAFLQPDAQGNQAIWVHTPGSPAVQVVTAGESGSVAPRLPLYPDVITTFATNFNLRAFNQNGQIAFTDNLRTPPIPAEGGRTNWSVLVRCNPPTGSPTFDLVAYQSEGGLPGVPGQRIGNVAGGTISMNSSGIVSFRVNLWDFGVPFALFRWGGALTKVAAEGDATGITGGGTIGLARGGTTFTLNNGSVLFQADVASGTAFSGAFLFTAGTLKVLTSSAANLPAGSQVLIRTPYPNIAGNYVAFRALRTGGQETLWVYNITTGSATRIAADGDPMPVVRGKMRLNAVNSRFVNIHGQVVFQARAMGGTANGGNVILMGAPGGPLKKVVAQNDVYYINDPNNGSPVPGTFNSLYLNAIVPRALNEAGQVVFLAYVQVPWGNLPGVFVGSSTAAPQKVALSGDPILGTSWMVDDPYYGAFTQPEINALGQVAFQTSLYSNVAGVENWGDGYFTGMGGGTFDKIVASGDPGPFGTIYDSFYILNPYYWSGFGFNRSGQVAFAAALKGWPLPWGGVFLGHAQAPTPATIVLNSDPAPVLGDYSITQPNMDIALNDDGDLLFRSNLNLPGGDAGSGLFLSRAWEYDITPVMSEGQDVPGVKGKFLAAMPTVYGYGGGENMTVTPGGNVLFIGQYMEGNTYRYGLFRFATDNKLTKVFAIGDSSPQTGGTISDCFWLVSSSETGRAVFWGQISDGNAREAIYITK